MDYKIVIDPSKGGDDIGVSFDNIFEKDYNLNLAKYINSRLNSLGIKSYLTRDTDKTLSEDERINIIKNKYGNKNDVIVVSLRLNDDINNGEIIYALRNSSELSNRLSNNLNNNGFKIDKYYQRRLPSDVSKDYYKIIRDTGNNQTLIIDLGSLSNESNRNNLVNNYKLIGEAIVKTIANYLGFDYEEVVIDNAYTVKKGDSLYSIAKEFNTTVNELKKINNLSSNLLSIGQILKLPSSTNVGTSEYIVKKGDNLYSIARKYNSSVEELKRINNLSSNLLSIGQILKIPSSNNVVEDTTYIVKKGDSLYSIARSFNTTVNELKKINNLNSNLLSIGQILKIK